MDEAAARTYRDVMMADPPGGLSAVEEARLERAFGEVWARPGLGRRERRLVTITCTAFAVTPQPIIDHTYAAMKSGDVTIEELLEVVLHFAVYCGWPKASNLEMYVRQSWAQVQEEQGGEPVPLPQRSNDELGDNDWERRLQRGAQEFADVNLVPAPGRDTPYQHAGILNYVFGHVWQRPGLSRRDRRFVTVASVGVDEAPIPIRSHVGSALKSGDITKTEMDELILQFRTYDNDRRADVLQATADAAWAELEAARA
ncbi:MAG TPA: carboxymuconolactone decarboxylase family protein [Acidimicrobiales bacterium]|nr:carboxymuconolactone decarboxylase family protein [Acidimicrobiales bacterium]